MQVHGLLKEADEAMKQCKRLLPDLWVQTVSGMRAECACKVKYWRQALVRHPAGSLNTQINPPAPLHLPNPLPEAGTRA